MDTNEKNKIIALLQPSTLEEHMEVAIILSEITQELILKHHNDEITTEREGDAKFTLQIIHSKIKHILELAKGIKLNNNSSKIIIDPSIQIIISRNIFESVIFFNLLYIYHVREEEKTLIHDLWKLSTLKYRNRFFEMAKVDEVKGIMQGEKNEIVSLSNKITNSDIYVSGSDKTKSQINQAIKKKTFWTVVEEDGVNTS
jgi:hypothetical protein